MTNTRLFGFNGYGRFSAALKLLVISCGGSLSSRQAWRYAAAGIAIELC